ncbi:glucose-6-phosphate dehydrogenase assembly protein OpcA [Candidatus Cyanaurora vandensis]|uniref:glucose-6-phosphate dehydrogenase assembly protein OpcA n=1 Tax=Candidatus Cyanaurora vandensis TaxID=2714958 RepID=UPI002580D07F|nr:glucose-6-phosphate dehydrogenase assembly protein OpcA [Candidatus Cyanaurora vandensis]
MTPDPTVYAIRAPKQVPLNQVDQELSRIWATQDDGQLKTRASTFNLIVFSGGVALDLENTIGAVAVQYPCRTLAIMDDPTAPADTVATEVTAYCPLGSGGQPAPVCCEYVTLRATGNALHELYTTVLPLLIPDLPTYLWWQGIFMPTDSLFSNLRVLAERLIVDSGTPGTAADLTTLDQLPTDQAIGDLNWWRLAPWRELTAKAFDNEGRLAALSEVHRVELEYVGPNLAQPLLFLGWLSSRLGWQFQEQWDNGAVVFSGPQGEIEAVWREVPGTTVGALATVRLLINNERYLLIRSGVIADCVQLQLEEEGQCTFEQVTALGELRLDELLAQELQTNSQTDPYYREALAMACTLSAP